MLSLKDAIDNIGKTVDGFKYFINSNGNLNCTSLLTGMSFYASATTNEWVEMLMIQS